MRRQMAAMLPRLHSDAFGQRDLDELMADRQHIGEVVHSSRILSCLLSAATFIIREIQLQDGSRSLRVME